MLVGLIPVFNEERNVIQVLDKLYEKVKYVVIINDGSSDNSDMLISRWVSQKENVHYITNKRNCGMAKTLSLGFNFISEKAKSGQFSYDEDVLVLLDADGQHDPGHIDKMYNYFCSNELDLLIANRDLRTYPKYRIYGNKIISAIISLLLNFKFNDIESGFRIMKVSLVGDILQYYMGFRYSCAGEIAIVAKIMGKKIDNGYPINVPYDRKGGPCFLDVFINLTLYYFVILKIKTSWFIRLLKLLFVYHDFSVNPINKLLKSLTKNR
jgi:glycosyltransferase involved in cell wall biosynthesis